MAKKRELSRYEEAAKADLTTAADMIYAAAGLLRRFVYAPDAYNAIAPSAVRAEATELRRAMRELHEALVEARAAAVQRDVAADFDCVGAEEKEK